jgi:MFS family permease
MKNKADEEVDVSSVPAEQVEPDPVRWPTLFLIIAATFGSGMALVVPMAYSLALRLTELQPGSEQSLGYLLGTGALLSLITAPLTGILSDRTKSRWGRRRPFTVLGLVAGLAAVPVLIHAPSIPVLAAGWALTTFGWGTVGGSIGNLLADRLPRRQRGSVSGWTNLAGYVAPVVGILMVSPVASDTVLLFLLPALAGGLLVLLFVLFVHEPDSRVSDMGPRLTMTGFLRSLLFNPRKHPAFAWVWGSRFLFFFGLSLTTSYTTYFTAQRLGIEVSEVATVMAVVAGVGVLAASLGALGAGWVSDRFGSRTGWTSISTVVFAAGCIVSALAWDLPMLLTGSILTSLGIAAFGSVGQALVLDVLPHRGTQAGRYLAITSYSQRIPAALAPMLAPAIIAAAGGEKVSYATLYVAAAGLAAVAATVILLSTKIRR